MKNILTICRNDLRRISSNVVAIVLILGLAVVPCLYAWFNIFSNWDPYGPDATSRIKVAVASEDAGASVLGLKINIGSQVISALEANDTIGWQFVDTKQEALDLVYSGDCYAALVVDVYKRQASDGTPCGMLEFAPVTAMGSKLLPSPPCLSIR